MIEFTVTGAMSPEFETILTPEALAFVLRREQAFGQRRRELLARRNERQAAIDNGQMPDFLPETAVIRSSDWTVAPIPADLQSPAQ